jgi:hypothetical protein
MNIEGLWRYRIEAEGEIVRGVAVLETGRIFGGDSGVSILGTYTITGEQLVGEAETIPQDDEVEVYNIFGGPITDRFVQFALERHGDRLVGGIALRGRADAALPLTLSFVRELP